MNMHNIMYVWNYKLKCITVDLFTVIWICKAIDDILYMEENKCNWEMMIFYWNEKHLSLDFLRVVVVIGDTYALCFSWVRYSYTEVYMKV